MRGGFIAHVRRVIGAVSDLLKGRDGRRQAQRAYTAAMSQAKRDVDDESAAAALRAEIGDIPKVALEREIADWGQRQHYWGDRAYRLLVAARDGNSVAPIGASDRLVFEQEAILARLTIPDAFGRLADAEPELIRCEEVARAGKKMQELDVRGLVGPGARTSDPVLQGHLALQIALIYLWDCARGRNRHPSSFFERIKHYSHGTVHAGPIDH